MMRFEVDACLPAPNHSDLDDLTKGLGGLSLSKKKATAAPKDKDPSTTESSHSVRIISDGELVPQDKMVEVTTRSEKSFQTLNWGDPYPQIYLSQTPHLHVAVHRFGTFEQIHKYRLGEGQMKEIHARLEDGFKKLAVLLGIIVAQQREAGNEDRLSLVCQKGVLKVYENYAGKSCLPEELLDLFEEDGSE